MHGSDRCLCILVHPADWELGTDIDRRVAELAWRMHDVAVDQMKKVADQKDSADRQLGSEQHAWEVGRSVALARTQAACPVYMT